MTEDRGQRAEDREQMTEDRGRKTEGGRQRTDDGRQMAEDVRQRTDDGRQMTEDVGCRAAIYDLRLLIADFILWLCTYWAFCVCTLGSAAFCSPGLKGSGSAN